MTMNLSDIELADACQDLTSWVLQDDLIFQDFCQEAKETPSHPAGVPDLSSPFITMPDESMEMPKCVFEMSSPIKKEPSHLVKESHPLFFDQDLELQALMREEITHQQELDQRQFIREQEEQEQLMRFKELQMKREQEEKSILQQYEPLENNFNIEQNCFIFENEKPNADYKEIIFEEEPMDVNTALSNEDDGIYYIEDTTSNVVDAPSPYVISVPVSEAYQQQNGETFSIETDLSNYQQVPKPFIINLKRVTIPTESFERKEELPTIVVEDAAETSMVDSAELTLKDILESGSDTEVLDNFFLTPPHSSGMQSPHSDDGSIPSSTFSDDEYSPASSSVRKTKKTYSSIEKKLRKKEQNKRAALRYRQKKKEEEDAIQSVYEKELQRNKLLNEQRQSVLMELRVMSKLAKEMIASRRKNNS